MSTSSGSFAVSVRSMQELRYLETVRQGYDFSCGSAALATLLTFHYDRPTSEIQVFEKMWNQGDQAKIREHGFSLLDMKRYLESEGMAADGFKIPASRIGKIGVAGLILLEKLDTPHFVVVIGESNGELLVSDPARGIWNMSLEEVEKLWNSVFFVVREQASVARANFNDRAVWKSRRWSPLDDAQMAQHIVPLLAELPLTSEFNTN
ncbi:MAG: C39 family peptidase [Myxococcota bacterium]